MIDRHIPKITIALFSAATLVGCSAGGTGDLQAYIQEVKAQKPRPIKPLPEIKPVATFVFDPGDRRDPFTPDQDTTAAVTQVDGGTGIAPDPTRRKEELEGYSLDSLRMVGTMEQNDVRWGLIRSQDGTLHRVRVGNYMGMNNGQIVKIDEDEIELTEIVSDAPGQWREREATLALTQ